MVISILSGIRLVFEGFTWLGIGLQGLGLVCLFFFVWRRTPRLPQGSRRPGITIIKPCARNEDNEAENFATFFEQKYEGPLEILFVVSRMTDPIVPVVQKLIERYPHVDAKLVHSTTRQANWPKIDALYDAHQVASHDIVIWSDSDVMVKPDYCERMVEALLEPGVSVVTTPQYDMMVNNFPTALKVLGNNADVATYMMLYNAFTRRKYIAWGHSIAFRRSEFAEFEKEAWQELTTNIADDLGLPKMFTNHGRLVVHRNIYCPVRFSNKTLTQVFRQQEKFTLCQRSISGRWTYLLGIGVFPQIWAAASVLATGYSDRSVYLFLGVWAMRVLVSLLFEGLVIGSVSMTLRWFWTIPIWDILHLYFNIYGFLKDEIVLNGKVYTIKSLDQIELKSSSV